MNIHKNNNRSVNINIDINTTSDAVTQKAPQAGNVHAVTQSRRRRRSHAEGAAGRCRSRMQEFDTGGGCRNSKPEGGPKSRTTRNK